MPTTVYRVEHAPTGIGPFNHDISLEVFRNTDPRFTFACDERPMPTAKWVRDNDKYRFGCDRMDQLKWWIPSRAVPNLAAAGFVVAKYEVPRVAYRDATQVAFRAEVAKKVAVLQLKQIFEGVPTA